jgi:GNAT superfamily N-acetyltransferase
MTFTVRTAKFTDCPSLADLLREIGWFEFIKNKTPEEAADHIAAHLADCLADESHSVYVGVDDEGKVMGYVNVHWLSYLFLPGPEGYISELFLRPLARGQGLGAELLETVKAEARERGASRLSLLNNRSRESYERGFYQKHGWEERQIMANFIYRMPVE